MSTDTSSEAQGTARGPALGTARIGHCRLCGHGGLQVLHDLGDMASCGYFPTAEGPEAPVAPMVIVRCDDCGLIQLQHNYDLGSLFRETYGYRSGLNQSMVAHLKTIADAVSASGGLQAGDIVLDIGANDGTLLKHYAIPGLKRIGIDPTILQWQQFYPDDILKVPDFFTKENFRKIAGDAKAKAITSIAMLYDLTDPNAFVEAIADALHPDGLWVMEQSYLPSMMAANAFDTICHEHLEYYGLLQIERLLAQHGLRIADVVLNKVNGGSFQVHACHTGSSRPSNTANIEPLLENERHLGLHRDGQAFDDFIATFRAQVDELMAFLRRSKAEGKLVMGYGASTKGNTILQYCGITPELMPAIAECNTTKWGRHTPGSLIPIISEEEARAAKPDFFLALPWHFRTPFLERERDFLQAGGHFVFPFPHFEIVGRDAIV